MIQIRPYQKIFLYSQRPKHVEQDLCAGAGVGRCEQYGQDLGRDRALHDQRLQAGPGGRLHRGVRGAERMAGQPDANENFLYLNEICELVYFIYLLSIFCSS